MNLSFEWLSDYLNLSAIQANELAERMSRTGIEIESVFNYADEFSDLKVGYVASCQPHPDSDHLNVTQVDLGQGELVQIVCGAPNIKAGVKVIVAPVGAKLPGGLEIAQTELRGVASNGMICSLQELGLPDKVVPKKYHDGIFYLPEDAPIGGDISQYLKLDDPILELDLTPNRADALSVFGTVYEVAAITDQAVQHKAFEWPAPSQDSSLLTALRLGDIDPTLAPHFTLMVVDGLQVQESPLWLQMRLMKMGIRPLNNVVDVTNYTMLLFGQPLHAYDYDQLPGHNFAVRKAHDQEELVTLDEETRQLSAEDIVISVDNKAVGLAGVMGGLSTHVTDQTQRIVLEAARFDATSIRKTAKRHDLRSESSARNEKGLNIATVDLAASFAANLIAQIGQGQVIEGQLSQQEAIKDQISINTTVESVKGYLGMALDVETIGKILDRLGFAYDLNGQLFSVKIPHRRWDVNIEADLMEEIARIYGYDNIVSQLPQAATAGSLTPNQRFMRFTRQILEGLGLSQVQTYVLTSKDKARAIHGKDLPLVELALPMSEERTSLRQTLFHNLLDVAQYNLARQQTELAIYETGRVFISGGQGHPAQEIDKLAILLTGKGYKNTWYQAENTYDFYDLKGIIESYFDSLQISQEISYQACKHISQLHPGRSAEILYQGQVIGLMGQIHPQIADHYDLPKATLYLELNLMEVIQGVPDLYYHQLLNKYPSSSRDLALLVSNETSHAEIMDVIRENGGSYLISISLFDRYQGDKIEEGKQSLAYQLVFQDSKATMTDEAINEAMEAISQAIINQLNGEIR